MKDRKGPSATKPLRSLSLLESAHLIGCADAAERSRRLAALAVKVPRIAEKHLRWAREDEAWLQRLADAHGVATGDYRALALALAHRLYPPASKRGPAEKWDELALAALFAEVDLLTKRGSAKNVKEAAGQLAKKPHWRRFLKDKDRGPFARADPGEALRRAYYEAKRRRLDFFVDVYAEYRNTDPRKWDSFVVRVLNRRM